MRLGRNTTQTNRNRTLDRFNKINKQNEIKSNSTKTTTKKKTIKDPANESWDTRDFHQKHYKESSVNTKCVKPSEWKMFFVFFFLFYCYDEKHKKKINTKYSIDALTEEKEMGFLHSLASFWFYDIVPLNFWFIILFAFCL